MRLDSHGRDANSFPLPLQFFAFLDCLRQILEGGAKYRGWMPGFEGSLSEQELEAVIAYFQSKWSDETYQVWLSRNE